VTLIARGQRHYAAYASPAVGKDSGTSLELETDVAADDNSITLGARQALLFQSIAEARATASKEGWDGEGGFPVGQAVVNAAIQLLCALPAMLPPPDVSPQPTGEIAFEWYKDRNHVAVLAVDGAYIRWSALTGPDKPVSGAEPFTRTVPASALGVVGDVIT
jgi:hypothetical protein